MSSGWQQEFLLHSRPPGQGAFRALHESCASLPTEQTGLVSHEQYAVCIGDMITTISQAAGAAAARYSCHCPFLSLLYLTILSVLLELDCMLSKLTWNVSHTM
jgi:hypothetical protein